MRCEDYPCCGCGPEGCVDQSKTNECLDCGRSFHPDSMNEDYCPQCNARSMGRFDSDFDYPDGEGW